MALQLRKASRQRARLKIGMSGPSGSGKTLGSLLLAYGIVKEQNPTLSNDEIWSKIAIIDTENGSGDLYTGKQIYGVTIGEYGVVSLVPPFTPDVYMEAIDLCVEANMEVTIIDSLTHAWTGRGGMLEQQGNAAKRTGNSYTAWREVTPKHNALVDKMLQSDTHIIATIRSKTEYVQEKDDRGKTVVRKVGLAPQFRDGVEFEFTTFLEIDDEHNAYGAKDRSGVYDQQYFKIDTKTGAMIVDWLMQAPVKAQHEVVMEKAEKPIIDINAIRKEIIAICHDNGGSKNEELMKMLMSYTPTGNPNKITDENQLMSLLKDLKEKYVK